jgi:UDP-2,4-diacetamido-2,4,6-trideoxy-beta-L-altropyranose hydrolase
MSQGLRIAVRADASARIGTGHLTRCVALARALRQTGADIRFITRAFDVSMEPLLREFAVANFALPVSTEDAAPRGPVPHAEWAGVDWETDAAQTVDAARDFAPSHIVVDHYAFDARWHRHVARSLGSNVIVIDDLADRDLDGTLLVDHNAARDHRVKYGARWPQDRPLLGGPRFALLDAAYATAPRAVPRTEVGRIGIFMGGADASGFSSRVLEACRAIAAFAGDIEVVTTSANPRLSALRADCARWPRTTLSLDLPDLAQFHAGLDLEIGAGGGSSWERCCIGVPTLLIATAQNQRVVVDELTRLGAAAAPTPAADPDVASIGAAVRRLIDDAPWRARLAQTALRLVDGLGALRAALAISAGNLTLRRAEKADAERIHQWRNHPDTRAVSGDSGEIPWEAHRQWYEAAIADPARSLFVAAIGTRAIGVIRFDRRDDGYHQISLFLDPALHGLGLGGRMLRAGEAAMGAEARFRAQVVAGNARSQQLFAAAGYVSDSPGTWIKSSQPR